MRNHSRLAFAEDVHGRGMSNDTTDHSLTEVRFACKAFEGYLALIDRDTPHQRRDGRHDEIEADDNGENQ